MNRSQILFTAILSTLLTLTVVAGSLLVFGGVAAAPSGQGTATPTPPVITRTVTYLSVSSMAFMPLNQKVAYQKDVRRQLLTRDNQPVTVAADGHIFVAPLVLPHQSILSGMTVFGEDFATQGAVLVRLKRCDHSQARCLSLAETSSTNSYAGGQFETLSAAIPDGLINNYFYSYFLELELTALTGSGLRSVRLAMVADTTPRSPTAVEVWTLTGDVTSFLLPNQELTQARICTDDLSHLDNPTHYPELVVDGHDIPLSSNTCVNVLGYTMQIRRELNAGSSSGTYQFLP